MTATKRQAMLERIEQHGRNLLAIFPEATERDPVKLCKRLRRLEREAAAVGLRLSNGPEYAAGQADALTDAILDKVNALLDDYNVEICPPARPTEKRAAVPIFVNRDPRGYALKIDSEWMRDHPKAMLHTDFGGYGIIAPDFSE